jgi:hypothetical protein
MGQVEIFWNYKNICAGLRGPKRCEPIPKGYPGPSRSHTHLLGPSACIDHGKKILHRLAAGEGRRQRRPLLPIAQHLNRLALGVTVALYVALSGL